MQGYYILCFRAIKIQDLILFQICCFVPFYDLGENKSRLERIRETANVAFTLVEWGKDHQPA